jgi:hypothetical protein
LFAIYYSCFCYNYYLPSFCFLLILHCILTLDRSPDLIVPHQTGLTLLPSQFEPASLRPRARQPYPFLYSTFAIHLRVRGRLPSRQMNLHLPYQLLSEHLLSFWKRASSDK